MLSLISHARAIKSILIALMHAFLCMLAPLYFPLTPHTHPHRGKSSLGQSEQFKSFRSTYALRQLAVDLNDGEWRFYDGGPKDTPVLLCLPGASGTAECFYRMMDGLCPKGYRVVAAQHPPYFTINEFVIGMDAFLDALEVPSVHILGAALGGLLAQQVSAVCVLILLYACPHTSVQLFSSRAHRM